MHDMNKIHSQQLISHAIEKKTNARFLFIGQTLHKTDVSETKLIIYKLLTDFTSLALIRVPTFPL